MIFSFASFELDTDRCALSHAGRELELRPQCYDLLLLLLEHPGKVIGRNEIVDRIWKDVAVTEDSLTQCVSHLRHALGPEGAEVVRTVPRRGYLLDAPVTRVAPDGAGTRSDAPRPRRLIWLAAATVLAALAGAAALEPTATPSPEAREPRQALSTSTTILGQPITYPAGTPFLVSGTVMLPPGETSAWHSHPAPYFAYVLAGELLVDYGPEGARRVVAGDGIVEAIGSPHRATNVSDGWAEILFLSIGAEGVPIRVEEPDPE